MDRTGRQSIRRWCSPQLCYALAAVLAAFAPFAAAQSSSNVVIEWDNAALRGVRDGTLGPPMVARAMAIIHTCMYDAKDFSDSYVVLERGLRSACPPDELEYQADYRARLSVRWGVDSADCIRALGLGTGVHLGKFQFPLDRLEARFLAQGVEERVGLQI